KLPGQLGRQRYSYLLILRHTYLTHLQCLLKSFTSNKSTKYCEVTIRSKINPEAHSILTQFQLRFPTKSILRVRRSSCNWRSDSRACWPRSVGNTSHLRQLLGGIPRTRNSVS